MNSHQLQVAGYKSKNAEGFTLVETLIAIAILMVAIAGPLTVANQALTAALSSRNAMIATYLAQDGMETLRNIKDNEASRKNSSSAAAGGWLSVLNVSSCTRANPATDPNKCAIPDKLHGYIAPQPCPNCALYVDSAAGSPLNYNYTTTPPSGMRTPFQRYVYFSSVNAGTINEAVVTVVVSWSDGSVPNQIQLQELMTDAPR